MTEIRAALIRSVTKIYLAVLTSAPLFAIILTISASAHAQSTSATGVAGITANAADALRRKDYPEALRLYLKAAESGDPQAQNNLGAMFQDAVGVERNFNEAMKWYQMSAKAGNVHAEKNIGDLYMDMEVPAMCRDRETGSVSLGCFWVRDPDDPKEIEALKWYLRAAEKGHPGAMTNLGRMFALGYGAKKNCAAARQWFKRAASAGNQAAIENLKSGVGGACR
jgi:TPR repeat protein